jgi:hypothetical protein
VPNSTYKKLAVQWLNEALCFISSFGVTESLELRNRQRLVAAKRYKPFYEKSANQDITPIFNNLYSKLQFKKESGKRKRTDNL